MKTALASLLITAAAAHGGENFVNLALKLRQDELLRVGGPPIMSPAPRRPAFSLFVRGYSWHSCTNTIFWCGESAREGGGSDNYRSAWDPAWLSHIGSENPFYVALPYSDVQAGHTRPEAPAVIPWFRSAFVRDGQSVCKDRWVAIRHGNRICYAQWEDVGPFQTDHWQYVFGNERPRPNRNQDAGIDVSPAVRDILV